MKSVRQGIRKLAWTLTLAVAAWLLPASLAHAGSGHGGGHAGPGGSGSFTHHGHHPYSGGYGWTWGGYYPYWGYDPFYGGSFGYGGTIGVAASTPYSGVHAPFGGVSPVGHSTMDDVMDFMGSFR